MADAKLSYPDRLPDMPDVTLREEVDRLLCVVAASVEHSVERQVGEPENCWSGQENAVIELVRSLNMLDTLHCCSLVMGNTIR